MRDARVKHWQEKAGLTLPDPESAKLLHEWQRLCFDAIRIIELEVSGIRDGDSGWSGSDPVGGVVRDMQRVFEKLYPVPPAPPEWWYREQAKLEGTFSDDGKLEF
jgi:hypothetical protein